MENSYDEECFKNGRSTNAKRRWKSSAVIGKRENCMDVYGVAFIEESYERQGYRMGIPKQAYVSRVLANIRKEER